MNTETKPTAPNYLQIYLNELTATDSHKKAFAKMIAAEQAYHEAMLAYYKEVTKC